MRCQEYGHSKSYCYKPHICVKCGGQHDTRTCEKPRNTPAKCALCKGDHPANYKGCCVYKNLIHNVTNQRQTSSGNQNQSTSPTMHSHQNPPSTQNVHWPRSYANVVQNKNNDTSENLPTNLGDQLTRLLDEFKNMFSQLLNQNSMILNLLTAVINKINH